jgi:large subunit ribosomal protein L4
VLGSLQLQGGTTLIVSHGVDKNLFLAARNLREVELATGDSLNTYQILRSDKLVFTRTAFEDLEQRLTTKE